MQRWKSFPRFFLLAVLLIGLLAGISAPAFVNRNVSAAGLPGDLVISEFRTRGPINGGNDEFIELYNPKPYPVDVSGWQVWGSSSAGITSSRFTFPLDETIAPGQHYLIVRAGTGGYSGAIDGDGTFGTGISDDGGIAITLPDGVTIIDQVGMDIGSLYKEPDDSGILTPMTPADGTADNSYERLLGGLGGSCSDSDFNSADFQLGLSDPQNKDSAIVYCFGIETVTPSFTPTSTATGTPTGTATITGTPTKTATPTATATFSVDRKILINEVAWAGTSSTRTGDEWIELYNRSGGVISLDGWELRVLAGTTESVLTTFTTGDSIPVDGFFLLARSNECNLTDYRNTFQNVDEDKCFSTTLTNNPSGQALFLYDNNDNLRDTANLDQGNWPAGSSTTYSSMERKGNVSDNTTGWFTYAGTPVTGDAVNRDGLFVKGTPKKANWFLLYTPPPTSRVANTATPRPRTPTPIPPEVAPVGRPFINEFLPRPGFDWNLDGKVDTFDEFIELKNVGNADMNLSGWRLDDSADFPGALSSAPYTITDLILKPGEYAVFYASQTNILLSDGGDSVRLFDASGDIMDVIDFTIAKVEDESVCRLPDGNGFGSWFNDCTPTPNLTNSRDGQVPTLPEDNSATPFCALPDTLPADFLFAECRGYGANIWDNFYWDEFGWMGDQIVPENKNKWKSFIE